VEIDVFSIFCKLEIMGIFIIFHPKLSMDVQYFVCYHVIIKFHVYDVCKIKLHFKISITNLETIFEVDACRQERQQWLH
jgi:hypothetical protein